MLHSVFEEPSNVFIVSLSTRYRSKFCTTYIIFYTCSTIALPPPPRVVHSSHLWLQHKQNTAMPRILDWVSSSPDRTHRHPYDYYHDHHHDNQYHRGSSNIDDLILPMSRVSVNTRRSRHSNRPNRTERAPTITNSGYSHHDAHLPAVSYGRTGDSRSTYALHRHNSRGEHLLPTSYRHLSGCPNLVSYRQLAEMRPLRRHGSLINHRHRDGMYNRHRPTSRSATSYASDGRNSVHPREFGRMPENPDMLMGGIYVRCDLNIHAGSGSSRSRPSRACGSSSHHCYYCRTELFEDEVGEYVARGRELCEDVSPDKSYYIPRRS